jgi:hypothetical protein
MLFYITGLKILLPGDFASLRNYYKKALSAPPSVCQATRMEQLVNILQHLHVVQWGKVKIKFLDPFVRQIKSICMTLHRPFCEDFYINLCKTL